MMTIVPVVCHLINIILTTALQSTHRHDSTYVPKSQRSQCKTVVSTMAQVVIDYVLLITSSMIDFLIKVLPTKHKLKHKHRRRRQLSSCPTYHRIRRLTKHQYPPYCKHQSYSTKPLQYQAFTTCINQSANKVSPKNHTFHRTNFDAGTYSLRIDNHCSYCVTNSKDHFIGQLSPMNAIINGLNGSTRVQHKGTIKWEFDDDLGRRTTHHIPNTLYVPSITECIFSPQHWSQTRPTGQEAHVITDAVSTRLIWDNGASTCTVPLDPITNVATLQSSSNMHTAIQALASVTHGSTVPKFNTDTMTNDESSIKEAQDLQNLLDKNQFSTEALQEPLPLPRHPRPITFEPAQGQVAFHSQEELHKARHPLSLIHI